MPSPVDIDLEYARRVKKAEQMRLKALELAETAHKLRLSNIEEWKQEQLSLKEEKKKKKEETPKEPRIRRTKEQIEIDESKERLKKERDAAHQRHLEKKAKEQEHPSNTVPAITTVDRNRGEVFGGVVSFLGFDEQEEEEEEEDTDDEWDMSDMSESSIKQMLAARQRQGIEIPIHLLHYLEPQKKKSSITDLPPPAVNKPSMQIEKRKVVKQVKGLHSYQLPLEDV